MAELLIPLQPEQVPEDFKCSICYTIPLTPALTPCEHVFCMECVQRAVITTPACPLCRRYCPAQHISDLTEGSLGYRVWSGIRVKCAGHDKGCTWTGSVVDGLAHIETCQFGSQVSQVEVLQCEKAKLEEELEQAKLAHETLGTKYGRLKSIHTILRERYLRLKKKHDDLNDKYSNLEQSHTRLMRRRTLDDADPDEDEEEEEEEEDDGTNSFIGDEKDIACIVVENCGKEDVNGTYYRHGILNDQPIFAKGTFRLYQARMGDLGFWYLSSVSGGEGRGQWRHWVDHCTVPMDAERPWLPPTNGWLNTEARLVPAPTLRILRHDSSSTASSPATAAASSPTEDSETKSPRRSKRLRRV